MRALRRAIAGVGLLGLLGGCGGSASDTDTAERSTLMILAAASLTEAFTELAEQYEADHPEVTIHLSFGSSTTLAQQITAGADADLFASAGTGALEQLPPGYADETGEQIIASNVLEIAVLPGNPSGVTGLADFERADIDTVLCAQTVPCGRAADEAFAAAGLTPTPVSRELDVKATLAKISLGEADAAIVYRSDVVTDDAVEGVEIPAEENVSLSYPLISFNTDTHTIGFAEFLAGPQALAALETAGFSAP